MPTGHWGHFDLLFSEHWTALTSGEGRSVAAAAVAGADSDQTPYGSRYVLGGVVLVVVTTLALSHWMLALVA